MSSRIACHECDLLQIIPALPEKASARCVRCGAVLYRRKPNSINRTLAWTFTGLIFFVLANCLPFLAMKSGGFVQETKLVTGIIQLFKQGLPGVSALVMLTCVIFPLLDMAGTLYVLLPLKLNRAPRGAPRVFRLIQHIRPWGMVEIFMLGILVALVKLAKMAEIIPGLALYSFIALMFAIAAAANNLDSHLIWEKLGRKI